MKLARGVRMNIDAETFIAELQRLGATGEGDNWRIDSTVAATLFDTFGEQAEYGRKLPTSETYAYWIEGEDRVITTCHLQPDGTTKVEGSFKTTQQRTLVFRNGELYEHESLGLVGDEYVPPRGVAELVTNYALPKGRTDGTDGTDGLSREQKEAVFVDVLAHATRDKPTRFTPQAPTVKIIRGLPVNLTLVGAFGIGNDQNLSIGSLLRLNQVNGQPNATGVDETKLHTWEVTTKEGDSISNAADQPNRRTVSLGR